METILKTLNDLLVQVGLSVFTTTALISDLQSEVKDRLNTLVCVEEPTQTHLDLTEALTDLSQDLECFQYGYKPMPEGWYRNWDDMWEQTVGEDDDDESPLTTEEEKAKLEELRTLQEPVAARVGLNPHWKHWLWD